MSAAGPLTAWFDEIGEAKVRLCSPFCGCSAPLPPSPSSMADWWDTDDGDSYTRLRQEGRLFWCSRRLAPSSLAAHWEFYGQLKAGVICRIH